MRSIELDADPARRREVSAVALRAMLMGSATDESMSFAILDRHVELGGNLHLHGQQLRLLGQRDAGRRERAVAGQLARSRGIGDEITIATKVGGRPPRASSTMSVQVEGLSPAVIRTSAERSLDNLGRDCIDVYYAHAPDAFRSVGSAPPARHVSR